MFKRQTGIITDLIYRWNIFVLCAVWENSTFHTLDFQKPKCQRKYAETFIWWSNYLFTPHYGIREFSAVIIDTKLCSLPNQKLTQSLTFIYRCFQPFNEFQHWLPSLIITPPFHLQNSIKRTNTNRPPHRPFTAPKSPHQHHHPAKKSPPSSPTPSPP